jgi:hypothetical protein
LLTSLLFAPIVKALEAALSEVKEEQGEKRNPFLLLLRKRGNLN